MTALALLALVIGVLLGRGAARPVTRSCRQATWAALDAADRQVAAQDALLRRATASPLEVDVTEQINAVVAQAWPREPTP